MKKNKIYLIAIVIFIIIIYIIIKNGYSKDDYNSNNISAQNIETYNMNNIGDFTKQTQDVSDKYSTITADFDAYKKNMLNQYLTQDEKNKMSDCEKQLANSSSEKDDKINKVKEYNELVKSYEEKYLINQKDIQEKQNKIDEYTKKYNESISMEQKISMGENDYSNLKGQADNLKEELLNFSL